jgi:hypothetical protein
MCGYENTPTARTLLRRYKKAFGDIPVREMIHRGWINLGSVAEVRAELIRFFGLKDAAELEAFIAGELDPLAGFGVLACNVEPDRPPASNKEKRSERQISDSTAVQG